MVQVRIYFLRANVVDSDNARRLALHEYKEYEKDVYLGRI